MIVDLDSLGRTDLRNLIDRIEKTGYSKDLVDHYVDKVESQYEILEQKELREICSGIEVKNIEELLKVKEEIREGRYQEKYCTSYYELINSRLESLHLKNLENACANIGRVDRNGLDDIKKIIDQEELRSELKNSFYDSVAKRSEQLDYEELCTMTNGLEYKSLDELEQIYDKIKNGTFNEKFVKEFLVKTRVAKECAQNNKVKKLVANISEMGKEEVISVKENISKLGYRDYLIEPSMEAISERLYQLDMLELLTINNNFDKLSLQETIINLYEEGIIWRRKVQTGELSTSLGNYWGWHHLY